MTNEKPTMKVEPANDQIQQPNTQITEQDLMNIFALPTAYVDHFFAGNSSGLIRLTFAEKTMGVQNNPAIPRTSVIMTPHAMATLHGLLGNIIEQLKAGKQEKPEREKLN